MLTNWYNEHFPRWAKILIQIFVGYEAGSLYRILLFVDDCIAKKEKKNVFALIMGIIAGFTFIGNIVFWIVDLITVIKDKKYSWLTEVK